MSDQNPEQAIHRLLGLGIPPSSYYNIETHLSEGINSPGSARFEFILIPEQSKIQVSSFNNYIKYRSPYSIENIEWWEYVLIIPAFIKYFKNKGRRDEFDELSYRHNLNAHTETIYLEKLMVSHIFSNQALRTNMDVDAQSKFLTEEVVREIKKKDSGIFWEVIPQRQRPNKKPLTKRETIMYNIKRELKKKKENNSNDKGEIFLG